MSNTPTNIEVNGFAIREIRIRSGIGVGPCADQAGISRPYLARIELGARIRVSPGTLAGLLSALQVADRRAILSNPHADAVEVSEAAS
jgi:transcriptional regulator with XRE-family HTH domain